MSMFLMLMFSVNDVVMQHALSCIVFSQAVRWVSTAKSVLRCACVRTEPTATTSGDSAPVARASWDTTVNRVSAALLPHDNNTAL